ncbi:MAG: type II secretion system protein GspM [Hyphomicrobium sp.]
MTILTKLASKFLALTLLVAVGWSVYQLALGPLVTHLQDVRERITEQRRLLGRYGELVTETRKTADSEVAATAGSDSDLYLSGGSDAVRIASLQSLIGRIAEAESLVVRSTRALPARDSGIVRLVGIEMQLSATIEQLQRILYVLETGRPALVVETLQITAPPAVTGADPAQASVLDVRLGLYGAVERKKA